MGPEEEARSLVAHMHADQTDAHKEARLAEALREAKHDGARQAIEHIHREIGGEAALWIAESIRIRDVLDQETERDE